MLKSRALESRISYSQFVDGSDGEASYELEFPWGGVVRVLGNIIHQAATTRNSTMLSFGAEGYSRRDNVLQVAHNTFVDDRARGVALRVVSGADAVLFANNVLAGSARIVVPGGGETRANPRVPRGELSDPDGFDYRLRSRSRWVGRAERYSDLEAAGMVPDREYLHPANSRAVLGRVMNPGAMQSTA
ncbi:MAG: hypothetical protein ACKVQQ_20025 [Burkholderiales bacterium]